MLRIRVDERQVRPQHEGGRPASWRRGGSRVRKSFPGRRETSDFGRTLKGALHADGNHRRCDECGLLPKSSVPNGRILKMVTIAVPISPYVQYPRQDSNLR